MGNLFYDEPGVKRRTLSSVKAGQVYRLVGRLGYRYKIARVEGLRSWYQQIMPDGSLSKEYEAATVEWTDQAYTLEENEDDNASVDRSMPF